MGRDYPQWICSSCGAKHGNRRCGVATWHVGTCDICGIEASVTEPRDFGHLQDSWKDSAVAKPNIAAADALMGIFGLTRAKDQP